MKVVFHCEFSVLNNQGGLVGRGTSGIDGDSFDDVLRRMPAEIAQNMPAMPDDCIIEMMPIRFVLMPEPSAIIKPRSLTS